MDYKQLLTNAGGLLLIAAAAFFVKAKVRYEPSSIWFSTSGGCHRLISGLPPLVFTTEDFGAFQAQIRTSNNSLVNLWANSDCSNASEGDPVPVYFIPTN
jgi:hypothetical protein